MIYHEDLHEIHASRLGSLQVATPNSALNEIVHRYFVITDEHSLAADHTYILPDNCAHLIFYLFDHKKTIVPKWVVVGPRSAHKIINRKHRRFTFICTFKPGGLRPLINIPVSEIRDLPVDSSELLLNYNELIVEQLTKDALRFDISQFVRHLEEFLSSSIVTSMPHPAVKGFYEKLIHTGMPLRHISKELGYSDRQLRNVILNNIGHSPKMVLQIERFTGSLRLRKSNDNWCSIAHTAGYYDQSHMISDYQKFVGVSPERLLH